MAGTCGGCGSYTGSRRWCGGGGYQGCKAADRVARIADKWIREDSPLRRCTKCRRLFNNQRPREWRHCRPCTTL